MKAYMNVVCIQEYAVRIFGNMKQIHIRNFLLNNLRTEFIIDPFQDFKIFYCNQIK